MDFDRVKGKAEKNVGRAESAYGRWADDTDLRAEGDLRQASGEARDLYGQAKDSVRDAMDRAVDLGEAAYDATRRRAEESALLLNTQVERNPAVAILIAAAAGYLLATLFRARRR